MYQALKLKDFYKADHKRQYPEGTELIYSNFTPRQSRIEGIDGIVVFGIQYLIQEYLIKGFNDTFFNKPKEEVVAAYKETMDASLGKDSISVEHIEALHDLQYLPIRIKALPEGSICPIGVPCLTIVNTDKKFFWVTNFLETLISTTLWGPMTSATLAFRYRQLLDKYAEETSDCPEFVDFQAHDFSMRGMYGVEAGRMSGAAHLLSFKGTDSISSIDFLNEYYPSLFEDMIGGSVPATEHSVMCAGMQETESETYKKLLTEVYPSGIVSVVSDTWDYWKVLTETLPELKDIIMNRDGKLVIRPDSGDPVKIVCGDPEAEEGSPEFKGTIQILHEVFGGTKNSKGYIDLDPHIGCIYGDSITHERCEAICEGLKKKGFSSTNIVFGIGSYTYQYVTRDTFGFAMKATYCEVNGVGRNLFKDPKTKGNAVKKSAKGLIKVEEYTSIKTGETVVSARDEQRWEDENAGLLETVYENHGTANGPGISCIRDLLLGRKS